ncbi:cyclic nucleotide-gated cation channel beta-1-like isoform X2 [Penaeus japonicus]|uniref:cyclic nucleotide-gated cation channel beta-1-like isoform X2 n=1 Tax=Penaeus japonicus TaxID=27405 RepID=UPI001C70DF85|nr:cyclic nucleotide-gated cation channel beta-1-like isoform X2 [Penaeus japonicus]
MCVLISRPPENDLMRGSDRVVSEAELRVRRSLQRLHVPEWMKNVPSEQSFLLKKRDGYGGRSSVGGGAVGGGTTGGWASYSARAGSMTSLGSVRSAGGGQLGSKVVIPTRVTSARGLSMTTSAGGGGLMTSSYGMGSMTSPSSASVSPSPSDKISLFTYPSGRWSSSRLNSGNVTPTGSVRTLATPTSLSRTPYLGWRSQTSLAKSQTSLSGSQSSILGSYMTPAERLALGVTSYSFLKSDATRKKEEGEGEERGGEKESEEREEREERERRASERESDEDREREGGDGKAARSEVDVHSSIREVTSAIVHYCKDSSPSPRATRGQRSRPAHPPPPVPSRGGGQDRSRSPFEGQERSRSPMEGQDRSRSPMEGQDRSSSALDDQERLFNLENQIETPRRSLTPLEGQMRSNSPLGGQMRSNSPLGGQMRSNSPRRLVWVESSFVGSRPIHSPETPTASTHALTTPTPTSDALGPSAVNGDGSNQVRMGEEETVPRTKSSTPGEYLLAW